MSLCDDLLAQGRHLASLDRGKPKQVNLRRAVSAAYYSLLHLLAAEAASRVAPRTPILLTWQIGRALSHTEMRDVCKMVSAGNPSAASRKLFALPFSQSLRKVCGAFVALQAARHAADYDISAILTRSDTIQLLDVTQDAFTDWKRIRKSDEATIFLAALLFAKRWDR